MSFICLIHNYTEYFSAPRDARGAVGGSVPCSRVSPQSWTIPVGVEIRTHNLGLQIQRSIH